MSATVVVIPRECNVPAKDVAALRKGGVLVIVADNAHLVKVLDTASVVNADGVVFRAALEAISQNIKDGGTTSKHFGAAVSRLALSSTFGVDTP